MGDELEKDKAGHRLWVDEGDNASFDGVDDSVGYCDDDAGLGYYMDFAEEADSHDTGQECVVNWTQEKTDDGFTFQLDVIWNGLRSVLEYGMGAGYWVECPKQYSIPGTQMFDVATIDAMTQVLKDVLDGWAAYYSESGAAPAEEEQDRPTFNYVTPEIMSRIRENGGLMPTCDK